MTIHQNPGHGDSLAFKSTTLGYIPVFIHLFPIGVWPTSQLLKRSKSQSYGLKYKDSKRASPERDSPASELIQSVFPLILIDLRSKIIGRSGLLSIKTYKKNLYKKTAASRRKSIKITYKNV